MQRFWSKVAIKGDNDCWVWQAALDRGGYGAFRYGDKIARAHRIAYLLHHGTLDPNSVIRHRCDNTKCCNPRHLISGTQLDNIRDMDAKGRCKRHKHTGPLGPYKNK